MQHAFSDDLTPCVYAAWCAVELPPLGWGVGQLRDWMRTMEARYADALAKAEARRLASAAR